MKRKNIISLAFYFFAISFSNVLALPSCPSSGYFDNCSGSDFLPDGSKYIGEYKQDKPHGEGILTKPNGDKYVGEWKNGDREGQGTFFYSNGDKYVGQWSANKLNGHGTFTWGTNTEFSGYKYVGQFKDNNREGQGVITYPDGDKYIGQWSDDKFNGNGTYIWGKNTEFSGYKFIGQYKDDKRYGLGVMTYSNGDKYDGNWKNNDQSGYGTYTFSDGRKYVGEWVGGKYQGLGKLFHSDGSVNKEGIFKNGQFLSAETEALPTCTSSEYFHNCSGIYEFDDGAKYVGEWQNNEEHGQGAFTFSNGNKYLGEFKDGVFNGQGTFTYPDGAKYLGEFKDGVFNGQGTFIWADGDKYLGEFKDGVFNGQGTFIWADGDKYVGEWLNDKKNGQGTYTYADGAKYVGEWLNNEIHGQGTFTYPDGAKYVGEWQNNEEHGQGTFTYPDGKKVVGNYENGKLNGYATKYYADGNIYQQGKFKDDEFLNTQETSPNNINKNNQNNDVIQASSGSGFAVSSDGYVITNNHVIEGCQEVIVHTKEKDIKTRIISSDRPNDLALLKGDFRPEAVLALSNNRPVLLEDIYVAGYPFGNSISSSIKVTKGIISSLTGIGNNYSNIQFDAALQPGNSGGPIIDNNGNVVAVAVSKLNRKFTLENFDVIPENTNFGIVSGAVKNILDSNDVVRPAANQSEISKERLRKMMSSGTYYISCWMTQAQIELLKSKKVLFEGLN